MITELDYPFGASDGWRKKACLQGAGLMNFTVCGNQRESSSNIRVVHRSYRVSMQTERLLATSAAGAILIDVQDCSAMRKHAQDIADLLESVAFDIMGGKGNAGGFGGWVLDNTKANMSAIEILE
jgi:hypothetical protein